MVVNWGQVLFNSAISGSLYLIGAVGLTLTYGLAKFPNFAHAEFITLGAFVGYFVTEGLGLGFAAALLVGFLTTAVLGVLCYRGVFRPLAARGASIIHLMVASIALSFVLRYSIGAITGWKPLYFGLKWPTYDVGAVRIIGLWLWLILAAVGLAVVLHFTLAKTRIGKAIRATSSNPDLALASGISTDRVIVITWFVGSGLAAFAGIFRGADTQVWPTTGWDLILPMFAVAILGGIGNFYGAIAAAFIIGLVENMSVVGLVSLGLSTEYRIVVAFLIIIVTLIVRPQGLATLFRRA